MRRSLRFPLLLVAAIISLFPLCFAQPDPEGPTCDDLPSLPPTEDRCAFVKQHCESEGLLPILPFYFCHVRPYSSILGAITVLLCASLLIVLFKLIGEAADQYFACILSQICQDTGLPPRLGGVTLLALGNGAPDLSSSIAAVRSGNYPLALGALTGSSMFVGCVVAGRIVVVSRGVKSRGAQIRDVLAQFIALLTIIILVWIGKMTYITVGALLSLYVLYVIVVAVADFTKRAGFDWKRLETRFLLFGKLSGAAARNPLIAPLLQHNGSNNSANGNAAVNGVDEELLEEEKDIQPTITQIPLPTPPPQQQQQLAHSQSGGSEVELMSTPPASRQGSPVRGTQSLPAISSSTEETTASDPQHPNYDQLVHMSAKEYRQRALADMAAAVSFYKRDLPSGLEIPELTDEEEDIEHGGGDDGSSGYKPPEISTLPVRDQEEEAEGSKEEKKKVKRAAAATAPAAISIPQYPATRRLPPTIHEETEPSIVNQTMKKMRETLETTARPILFLLKSTIPLVEQASYDRFWLLIASAASPLFICFYLHLFSVFPLFLAATTGAILSAVCWLGTRELPQSEAPIWDFGTGYPIGAGAIALYGFAVAAMWIDIFASEIVGILHFFGLLAGIHPAVLGVTVLAWGNSLTDYVGNTAMAGRSSSGTSMAMTACFAGPLFNMLVGLGVGFWTYLADTGKFSTRVGFDSVVAVGCVFAMVNCAGVVVTAFRNRNRLPEKYGWVMIGWYVLYMFVVLVLVLDGED